MIPRILVICAALVLLTVAAHAAQSVRVGVLQFGTVAWELETAKARGLDSANGIALELLPLASKDADSLALLGGAVDAIVGDWIWVNRQRAEGRRFAFFPYSLAIGGLYVRPDSGIGALADLKGRRLGVAGGSVDKSWLLLQALARAQGLDLARDLTPVFAAPPLLNRFMLDGELPAALNFWHYGARLEAAGMRPLMEVRALLKGLGVAEPVPMLGWVFFEDWAKGHPDALRGLLAASYQAKAILEREDAAWEAIRALTKAEDDATLMRLRDGYRRGIPRGLPDNGEGAAARVFAILAREGGRALVGRADALLPGTFWQGAASRDLLGGAPAL